MLLRYAIFLLYALLPFQVALNPAPGFDVASVRILVPLVAILWLTKSLHSKQLTFPAGPLPWLVLSFVFAALFSLFFAQNISWGFRKFFFLLTLFPLYFVLCDLLADFKTRRRIFFFLILGSTLLALVAVFQFLAQFLFGIDTVQAFWSKYVIGLFLGDTFAQAVLKYPSWLVNIAGRNYLRAIATFPDPHMLAFFFNMTLPFAIISFFTEKNRRIFFGLASFLILSASLLTFSRGGYLGLLASFFAALLLFLQQKTFSTQFKRKTFLSLGLLLLLILVTNNPVRNRLFSSFDDQDSSNQGRMLIWKQTVRLIEAKPQGVGIGNYALAILPAASYRDPIYAHNIYLDIAAELGLGGFFFWLSLLFAALWFLGKKAHKEPLFGAGFASLVAFCAHGLVENPLFSVHIFTLLMLILALASQKHYENA